MGPGRWARTVAAARRRENAMTSRTAPPTSLPTGSPERVRRKKILHPPLSVIRHPGVTGITDDGGRTTDYWNRFGPPPPPPPPGLPYPGPFASPRARPLPRSLLLLIPCSAPAAPSTTPPPASTVPGLSLASAPPLLSPL